MSTRGDPATGWRISTLLKHLVSFEPVKPGALYGQRAPLKNYDAKIARVRQYSRPWCISPQVWQHGALFAIS